MAEVNLVDSIEKVRATNNKNWMRLLRIALDANPVETKETLKAINENDKLISELLGKLADE